MIGSAILPVHSPAILPRCTVRALSLAVCSCGSPARRQLLPRQRVYPPETPPKLVAVPLDADGALRLQKEGGVVMEAGTNQSQSMTPITFLNSLYVYVVSKASLANAITKA